MKRKHLALAFIAIFTTGSLLAAPVQKDTIPKTDTLPKKDSSSAYMNLNSNLTAFQFTAVRDTVPKDRVPKKDSATAFASGNNAMVAFQFAAVRDTVPKDSVPKKDTTTAFNATAFNFINVAVRDTVPKDTIQKKDTATAFNFAGENLTAFHFSNAVVRDTVPKDTVPKKDSVAFNNSLNSINFTANLYPVKKSNSVNQPVNPMKHEEPQHTSIGV
jgi:hypothetical protein